mmetsp:Transcript_4844/g.7156  ORF Transcript_4844/g.7156 Transcript_4844/m.7156 type:complete len:159 (-) Transcript_4844:522-998(-)
MHICEILYHKECDISCVSSSSEPSKMPTAYLTLAPSSKPSKMQSTFPSLAQSFKPLEVQRAYPSQAPSCGLSKSRTDYSSLAPSSEPSKIPSAVHSSSTFQQALSHHLYRRSKLARCQLLYVVSSKLSAKFRAMISYVNCHSKPSSKLNAIEVSSCVP